MLFSGNNFWTRNVRKPIKFKDSDSSVVSNKDFKVKKFHLAVGAQGQIPWVKMV